LKKGLDWIMNEALSDLEKVSDNVPNSDKLKKTQDTMLNPILHKFKIRELKKRDALRGLSENTLYIVTENINDAFRSPISHLSLLKLKGVDFITNIMIRRKSEM
jgi:hypothetical protein